MRYVLALVVLALTAIAWTPSSTATVRWFYSPSRNIGCEVAAVDINPVAWFILKCTLEYSQRLANQQLPLPAFACQSREFMESYFKAKGFKDATIRIQLETLGLNGISATTSYQCAY